MNGVDPFTMEYESANIDPIHTPIFIGISYLLEFVFLQIAYSLQREHNKWRAVAKYINASISIVVSFLQ